MPAARSARLFFPRSANHIIDLWRCRYRYRRHIPIRELTQRRRQRQRRRQKTMI